MHRHRAEHWVVVSGMAEITNGDDTYVLGPNQSTKTRGHGPRLANPGQMPLEIIEVQSGDSRRGLHRATRYIYGRSSSGGGN